HYSTRAAAALVTVAEHDPATFADFWVALFAVQPAEGGAGLTNSQIRDVAEAVGVSQEAIDAIADGEFTQWVTQATQQASIDGVVRTPTIRIDGEVYTGNWTQPGQLVADVRAAGAQ